MFVGCDTFKYKERPYEGYDDDRTYYLMSGGFACDKSRDSLSECYSNNPEYIINGFRDRKQCIDQREKYRGCVNELKDTPHIINPFLHYK